MPPGRGNEVRHPRQSSEASGSPPGGPGGCPGQPSVQIAQGIAAGFGAPHAGFGADAAMLVHAGVLAAFLATGPAGGAASLDHRPDDFDIRAGAAACDRACGRADVGSVEVEADARPKLLDHGLGQAGIGA